MLAEITRKVDDVTWIQIGHWEMATIAQCRWWIGRWAVIREWATTNNFHFVLDFIRKAFWQHELFLLLLSLLLLLLLDNHFHRFKEIFIQRNTLLITINLSIYRCFSEGLSLVTPQKVYHLFDWILISIVFVLVKMQESRNKIWLLKFLTRL